MKTIDYLCKILEKYQIRDSIKKAFCEIDRRFFVPNEYKDIAYEDVVIPLKEEVTISQPTLLAYMIDILNPKDGDKILEIGTGSGYSTAILSYLVGKKGKIISMEIDDFAYNYAKEKINQLIKSEKIYNNISIIKGDGTLGYPKESPYDKIIVHTALPMIPNPLVWQLKNIGVIVAPVGRHYDQKLILAKKIYGKLQKEEKIPVIFVPSRGKFGFYSTK